MMTLDEVQAFLYAKPGCWTIASGRMAAATTRPRILDAVVDDDDQLTTDPQREISLIYYANKAGWKTGVPHQDRTLAASMPEPRTATTSTTSRSCRPGEQIELRFNWHTLSYRYQTMDSYFGTSRYTLDLSSGQPLIRRKHVC